MLKRLGEGATELYNEYSEVIVKLIDELASINMINFHYNKTALNKLVGYANERAYIINKLEFLITNNKVQDNKFTNDLDNYTLTRLEMLKVYTDMIIYLLIIDFGLLENILLAFVQQKKKHNNVTISGEEPLTLLLGALEKLVPNNGLCNFINSDLRNALAHFWYWVEGDKFYYCDNPWFTSPKELEPIELLTEFHKLNLLTKCIIERGKTRIDKIKSKNGS